MIAFDATVLLPLLYPNISVPKDANGKPIEKAKERLQFLVNQISKQGDKIIIPTPALSEVLVHAGDAMTHYLDILNRRSCFRIASFDEMAAIEVALLTAEDRSSKKKKGTKNRIETLAKIKYDRQIAAIAKVEGANTLYTDDDGQAKVAIRLGLKVIKISALPLPPEDKQMALDLYAPDTKIEDN
jgi:hypothetical protein